jgi:Trypsin-like peptidase domain
MAWCDSKYIQEKHIGFGIGNLAAHLIEEQLPELRGDFPNHHNWTCKQSVCGNVLLVTYECKATGIPVSGNIGADVANEILSVVHHARTYRELCSITELAKYFSREKLLFIVDLNNGGFDWALAHQFVVDWLNDTAVPHALKLNEKRILRAIPAPPQYSIKDISNALWILECPDTASQGSGFAVKGVGIVTCEHVISGSKAIRAFQASSFRTPFEPRIVKASRAIDLAVLEFPQSGMDQGLLRFEGQMQLSDHALVCGFPNYRYGDEGLFSPGVIIGTRQQSGIRRLLTNAPIVRGMSGGPAIGLDNKVVGICVTGADRIASADDTEDKSIIPIDALELL